MGKRFQKKWRKRNGPGCTYPACDCGGPMACMMKTPAPITTTTTAPFSGWGKHQSSPQRSLGALSQCTHRGDKVLFQINNSAIHAASMWHASFIRDAALIVQCADTLRNPVTLPAGYESLREHTLSNAAPTIVLPWPDFGTPPVRFTFWRALIDSLPAGKVIVTCQGSHGRTGTALAALLVVYLHLGAQDAIDYVRSEHCEEAIESTDQEEYLSRLAKWANGVSV